MFIGSLIGGVILIFLGFAFYLALTTSFRWKAAWALFLVLVGLMILGGAIYAAVMVARRHPQT
jgi:ABC-type antimicrobial peptide transport system permease subunit